MRRVPLTAIPSKPSPRHGSGSLPPRSSSSVTELRSSVNRSGRMGICPQSAKHQVLAVASGAPKSNDGRTAPSSSVAEIPAKSRVASSARAKFRCFETSASADTSASVMSWWQHREIKASEEACSGGEPARRVKMDTRQSCGRQRRVTSGSVLRDSTPTDFVSQAMGPSSCEP